MPRRLREGMIDSLKGVSPWEMRKIQMPRSTVAG
jgi:hypothetical protein